MKKFIQILFTIIIISDLYAGWEMNITAQDINGTGAGHTIRLGTDILWNDGWKFGEDESDYPDPFSGPYTNIHFFNINWPGTMDENGNICTDFRFSSDLRSEHPPEELITWSINGSTGGGMSTSVPIRLSWDNSEINLLSDEYDIYLYVDDQPQNMKETSFIIIPQSDLNNNLMPNIYILMGACAAEGTTTHYFDSDEDGWGGDLMEQYCLGYAPANWLNNNLDINDSIYCESNQLDCEGTLCGNAELDECGVCDGDNLNQDCFGNCYGTAIIANLCQDSDLDGLGNPESSSEICTELPIENNLFLDSNGSIFYNSNEPFYGLQFNVDGADILSASGGTAEENGFFISTNSNTIITFSLTSNPINSGTGNLINLELSEGPASISSLVVSDISGNPLEFTIFNDYELGYAANCSDLYPNCTENYFDCTDECGGAAIIDECGECNGEGANQGYNCAGYPEQFSYSSSSEQAFYFFNSITLDDNNLESNDWIGAFNGNTCVGARQWNNCEGDEICDIPVLGQDNSEFTLGYMSNGDIPNFKIFDASENTYFSASASDNIPWNSNTYNLIDSLSAISAIDYCLDLHYGANLKSFYALPSDANISNIMEDIQNVVSGVITESGACSQISDGIWVGSQCSISQEKGYWIITEDECELCISNAIPLDPNLSYNLYEGSNLISIPTDGSIIISEALPDNIELYVKGLITEGGACTQLNPGNWVGSQCFFVGGRGYWLITLQDIYFSFELSKLNRFNVPKMGSLKYPEGYKFNQSSQQAFYFVENINNLNNDINNWILAFNKNKVIGAQKWNGNIAEIPIMGNDGNPYSTGYIESGMKPTFKLLNTDTGELTNLTSKEEIPDWSNNNIFNLNSLLNTNILLPSKIKIDSYPNPFNPSTSISFSTISEGLVEIVIFNISGQLITTLVNEYKAPGNYQYNWDASKFTSGVYFAKLTINESIYTKKLVLMK